MNRMGSACSIPRHYESEDSMMRQQQGRTATPRAAGNGITRNTLRHSVVGAIPDGSIADLYPVQDNYVNVSGNLRSPKTLTDLCIDALCRSLPYLDGELPSGLPQDVVDDVSQSLVQHSALTATTLRVLRNCELGTLSLAKCRGVTDAWLEPFLEQRSDGQFGKDSNSIGLIGEANFSLKSSEAPYLHQTSFCDVDIQSDDGCDDETLDDICHDAVMEAINIDNEGKKGASGSDDAFFCKFNPQTTDEDAALSSSTSSFATADECHQHHDHYCMDVEMENENSGSSTAMYNPSWVPSSLTANLTLLDIRGSQELTDRGLLQLTHLGNLQVAKLDQCHALTGRGLLALCHSRQLHTLSLANCRRLMDEAVINISHLNSLRALSLDGCRCLTDRSLAAISELYRLEKLDLSQCDLITDDGLDELEHLQNLQELSLGWCRQITDAGLGRLTSHPGRERMLRVLRLARCTVSDKGIAHLATLLALEELDLNGCFNVVQGAALGQTLQKLRYLTVLDVSHCPGILRSCLQGKINALTSLELCYSGVKDSQIVKLLNMSTLEELNLDSCPLGDRAIAHLADNNVVPNLTSLDLADTNITDVGMVKIAKFTKLTRLSLFYCNISNSGLRHISALIDLQVLNLDSREISDEGLSHLRALSKLKSLDIFSGRITDSGCAHIAKIRSLESLELCGGGIGDIGCTHLATLDDLVSLNLSQNERITNRGAAALAALTNLKVLNLSNTRVNASALRYFSGLLKLQSLALYGCRDIENKLVLGRLQNGLPNLKCLRLNTSSAEDGMVMKGEESDDEEDDDESDEMCSHLLTSAAATLHDSRSSIYFSQHD